MTGFWDALNSFTPPDVVVPEFRVYYNDTGDILFYTSEDLPGDYLVIDHDSYAVGRYDLKVVNGKLKELQPNSRKLVPAETGTITEATDITIIAASGQAWQIKDYYSNED